jgi:hypothetical protein
MKNKIKQFLFVFSLLIISGFTAFSQSYCTPTTDCGISITSFNLTGENGNDINNSSTCMNGGYTDYTNLSATVEKGFYYQGNANVDLGTSTAAKFYVWVDWNQDGDFLDNYEFVYNCSFNSGSQTSVNFIFYVPDSALLGTTRMRLRMTESNSSGFGACTNSTTGETEDYSISVLQGAPPHPDCPINSYPADGATGFCGYQYITLTFDAVQGNTYGFFVGSSPHNLTTLLATNTSFSMMIYPNSTYYWRIVVTDSNGTTHNCPIWTFTTSDLVAGFSPDPVVACEGEDILLTGSSSGTYNGPLTYLWYGPGASSLNSTNTQNATFNSATAGSIGLNFGIEDSNGCQANAFKTITVFPFETVGVSIAVTNGNNPGCTGESLEFIATPTNGGSAPSYDWRVSGVSMSTDSIFVPNTLADLDVVDLVLTSNVECPNNPVVNSNSITISQVAMVPSSVDINLAQSSYCKGETLNFSAIPQNGGSSPTYEWYVDGDLAGTSSTFDVANLNDGQEVRCEMTSSLACVSASPALSNTYTIQNITQVEPKVVIGIIQGQNPSCEGDFVLFEASPTFGGPNPIFEWYLNGVFQSSGPTIGSSAFFTGDKLFCLMTSDEPCVTQSPVQSYTVEFIVVPYIPQPTITQMNDLLTSSAPSNNQWIFNNIDIPGATTRSLQITQNGLYSVRVHDLYCPSENAESLSITNAGLETLNKNRHLVISPNPSTGIYHIQTSEKMLGELKVFNVLGAEILSKKVNTSNSTIDLKAMKSGLYILLIETNSGKYTSRLIKN